MRVVQVVVDHLVADAPRAIVPSSSARIASRKVDGKRSASDSYAFPSSAADSGNSLSIPWIPAAMIAANARRRCHDLGGTAVNHLIVQTESLAGWRAGRTLAICEKFFLATP